MPRYSFFLFSKTSRPFSRDNVSGLTCGAPHSPPPDQDVYKRQINSISRLEAALDAVRDEDLKDQGTVEILSLIHILQMILAAAPRVRTSSGRKSPSE